MNKMELAKNSLGVPGSTNIRVNENNRFASQTS